MYEKYLKNGHSSGDNLLGFVIETEHYLQHSEMFLKVDVNSSDDKNCLIRADCLYDSKFAMRDVVSELTNIWLNYLRYNEFEIHSVELQSDHIIFNFCTTTDNIGVTGQIILVPA